MRVYTSVCVCATKRNRIIKDLSPHKQIAQQQRSSSSNVSSIIGSAANPLIESDPNGISGVVCPDGYARRPEFTLSFFGT